MNVNHLGMMKCKMTAVTLMYADGSTDGWPLGLSRHLPEKKNQQVSKFLISLSMLVMAEVMANTRLFTGKF